MRSLFRSPILWLAALAATGVLGCSLLVDFDPEGKPCDSNQACLKGYVCENDVCVVEPPPADAGENLNDGGTTADVDAGSLDGLDAGFDLDAGLEEDAGPET
jgi:hypothetical protein